MDRGSQEGLHPQQPHHQGSQRAQRGKVDTLRAAQFPWPPVTPKHRPRRNDVHAHERYAANECLIARLLRLLRFKKQRKTRLFPSLWIFLWSVGVLASGLSVTRPDGTSVISPKQRLVTPSVGEQPIPRAHFYRRGPQSVQSAQRSATGMAVELGQMQLLPSLLIRHDDAGIAREGDMVGFQQAEGPRVLGWTNCWDADAWPCEGERWPGRGHEPIRSARVPARLPAR